MFTDELRLAAADILELCREKGLQLATAESCTGGLIAALFTSIPGSSKVLDRGFVTYSDESKTELLGVEPDLISMYGAVSREVAMAMAQGALERARVDIAVGVTGVAGPGGGTPAKPVGLVFIAVATNRGVEVERNYFSGNRTEVRAASAAKAFSMMKDALTRSFSYVV